MRKILLSTFFILSFFITSIANASTQVEFIYTNGVNNNNKKMYEWFLKGIHKIHPIIKNELENDVFTKKYMLEDGEYVIAEEPSTYFWGDKPLEDLPYMREYSSKSCLLNPYLALLARNSILDLTHDAVWLRYRHNMVPILDDLNEKIKESHKNGKKVVLLGYSAGTFITFEYIVNKLPDINIQTWLEKKSVPKHLLLATEDYSSKNTCLDALLASRLAIANRLGGVIPNTDEEKIISSYKNIDAYTEKYCAPEDTIIGVINYANPIPLFYPSMHDDKAPSTEFLGMAYKYIIENKLFFLTVNYIDDPLGYLNGVNISHEELGKVFGTTFSKEQGFCYDYAKSPSYRTVLVTHTSYWRTGKRFAKIISKAYKEGYNFHYANITSK